MSRRAKVWVGVLVGGVIIVVVVAALLLHWASGSASGTVHVGNPPQSQAAQAPQPITVKTSYFTIVLPGGFSVKSHTETPGSQFLLHFEANTSAVQDEQFAATIGTLPADGLSEVGDYNLRATQTGTYARATLANLPAGTVAFRAISGPAGLTVFWPHGATYAELAFSTDGGATEAQLTSLYSKVLATWHWE